jgi:hypothetical protein
VLGDEPTRPLARSVARGRAEEIAGLKGFLRDAADIETRALDREDAITLDMLEVVCHIWLRQHELNVHHFEAMDQMAGPQGLAGDLSRFQRVDTPERIDRSSAAWSSSRAGDHRANLLGHRRQPLAAHGGRRVIEQTRRAA